MKKSNLEFSVNFHLAIGNQTPTPPLILGKLPSATLSLLYHKEIETFLSLRNQDFSILLMVSESVSDPASAKFGCWSRSYLGSHRTLAEKE